MRQDLPGLILWTPEDTIRASSLDDELSIIRLFIWIVDSSEPLELACENIMG